LVGDTAQLPPVRGQPLYSGGRNCDEVSRLLYFQHFTSVIELVESKRVDTTDPDSVWFREFLDRLADAVVTEDDYNKLCSRCSKHSMGLVQWSNLGFNDPNITHLFSTNADVDKHNEKALTSLGNPIVRIQAKNTSAWMRKLRADRCGQLNNVLFLSRDAKVTLTYNLCPEIGLANGSTGIVKDVVYKTGESPKKHIPYCVWVEMEGYTGPSFFPTRDEDAEGEPTEEEMEDERRKK